MPSFQPNLTSPRVLRVTVLQTGFCVSLQSESMLHWLSIQRGCQVEQGMPNDRTGNFQTPSCAVLSSVVLFKLQNSTIKYLMENKALAVPLISACAIH